MVLSYPIQIPELRPEENVILGVICVDVEFVSHSRERTQMFESRMVRWKTGSKGEEVG
jgi:hypothetical protein